MKWYYANINFQKEGPLTEEEMVRLITAKSIEGTTLVWNESLPEWQKLSSSKLALNIPPEVPSLGLPPTSEAAVEYKYPSAPNTSQLEHSFESSESQSLWELVNNKNVAWTLIGLGILDYALWITTGRGWTNVFFGDNIFTQWGPALMIFFGTWMLRWRRGIEKMQAAEETIKDGEIVIFQKSGSGSKITLTNISINAFIHEINLMRKYMSELPDSEYSKYNLSEISSIKVLTNHEIAKGSVSKAIGKIFSRESAIQITLKDGRYYNLPCSSPRIIADKATKLLL